MSALASHVRTLAVASDNRLACLRRHWQWADAARERFEEALSRGWEYETDPLGDDLLGAYYQWCALLCTLSEAAFGHGVVTYTRSNGLMTDLDACLPTMRACRQLLTAVPQTRELHPRIADLLRRDGVLDCQQRVHGVFGEILRAEQDSRALVFLDIEDR